jgi:hypothetical protein
MEFEKQSFHAPVYSKEKNVTSVHKYTYIYVKNKVFEEFSIQDIHNLTEEVNNLSLEHNKNVKHISGILPSNIERLHINYNDSLEEINVKIEENSKLNSLIIYNNLNLRKINIYLPNSLTHFICLRNKITRLPLLPPNLEHLNCSHNPIQFIPALPKKLKELKFIDTKVDEIPELSQEILITGYVTWKQSMNIFGKDMLHIYKESQKKYSEISKQRQIQKLKKVKEDLIAAAWHPKRFQSWCIDVQEKEFMSKERTIQEWMEFEI